MKKKSSRSSKSTKSQNDPKARRGQKENPAALKGRPPGANPKGPGFNRTAGAGIIFGLGLLIYANTFHSTFQFDDLAFIIRNYALRNPADFKGILTAVLDQPSRFVGLYSFAINYYFHQLDVVGYHVTNLAIHWINTFLVWWLAGMVLRLALRFSATARREDLTGMIPLASFFAAVIFLVHPVQTQAVTYISQRFASLATLFYFSAVGFYIKARICGRDLGNPESKAQAQGGVPPAERGSFSGSKDRRKAADRRAVERRQTSDRRQSQQAFDGPDRRAYLKRRKLDERRTHTARRRQKQSRKLEQDLRQQHRQETRNERDLKKQARLQRKQEKKSAKKQRKLEARISADGSSWFRKTVAGLVRGGSGQSGVRKKAKRDGRGWRVLFFGLSLACAVLGMFTKEIVVTLPLMILAVEFLLLGPGRDRRFVLGLLAGLLLLGAIVPALFDFKIMQVLFNARASESHTGDVLTFPKYFLTQLRVLAVFVRLLFVPLGQNFDYDFPMSTQLWQPWTTWVSLGLWIGMLSAAYRLRNRHRVLCFAVLWTFIAFSANLIPRRHVIFEHKLYLISFGFCLGLSYAVFAFVKNRTKAIAFLSVLVLVFAGLTYRRNAVWQNGITLWEDVTRKSPNKIRAHHNLGTYYRLAGRLDEALASFDRALELEPRYRESLNNRAGIYRQQGLYGRALKEYEKALSLAPEMSKLHNNKGNVYKSRGDYARALEQYTRAITLDPGYATAYYNRALIYEAAREPGQALADYNTVLKLDPEHAHAYNNRARLLCLRGKFTQALKDFDKAIAYNPDLVEAYFNKARTHEALGQFDPAFEAYHAALALDPNQAAAYFNMGNMSAQQGQYSRAAEFYSRVLTLNPRHYGARNNLRKVRELLKQGTFEQKGQPAL